MRQTARQFIEEMGIDPGLTNEGRALAVDLGLDPDDPETPTIVLAYLMENLASPQ